MYSSKLTIFHLDFAGLVKGKMYLIIIDAHSKWIEAVNTPSATSAAVIEELQVLFALFGYYRVR